MRQKPNIEKLTEFGFIKEDNVLSYHADLVDGQLGLTVTVDADGQLYSEVIDRCSGEEYVLHRIADSSGAFVGRVRTEYEAVLDEIYKACFDFEVFIQPQTKEILAYIREKYGDEPEFLWKKFPDNAVVRRKDNQKWYAAILTVSRCKLGGQSDEMIEIIDLRMKPDEIEAAVDHTHYYPGYHMNKKHWITVCLDGSVSVDEIFRRIDDSYLLALK